MITLKRDELTMAVSTSVQAAAFLRNGWKVVEDKPQVVEEPKVVEQTYTKTIINRKSTSELQEIAKMNGVQDAEQLTGSELKKILIEKFSL